MRTIVPFFMALLSTFTAECALADVDVRVGSGAGCTTPSIQTAINDSVAANGVTDIKIARNATYSAQQLIINGRNIRLIGGFASCTQEEPDPTRTVISGAGGAAASVISIGGATSNVTLQNLEIVAGDAPTGTAGYGGGINIHGGPHGYIVLGNTWIHDNDAGHGGGISINNESSMVANEVFVWLTDNTRIFSNYGAYGGGGIWCRNAKVVITGATSSTTGSAIYQNHTAATVNGTVINGPGGGMRIEDCSVHVATRHPDATQGTISRNVAGGDGGGISATGERARVELYTRDGNRPTSILFNEAGGYGGAIHSESAARVRAYAVIVSDNLSRMGGGGLAVVSNSFDTSLIHMTHVVAGAPATPGTPEGIAVNCNRFDQCNQLSRNRAVDQTGTARAGAAGIVISGAAGEFSQPAFMYLGGTKVSGNEGESIFRLLHNGLSGSRDLHFEGALLVGNTSTRGMIENDDTEEAFAGSNLVVMTTTIAGNTIEAGDVIINYGYVTLQHSIIWQPGKRVLRTTSSFLGPVDYMVVSDLEGLPASSHNRITDPLFVAPASSDYRLRLNSPAIDFAPPLTDPPGYLIAATADNLPRIVDLAPVTNVFGPQDLGAYERQFACADDTMFCNGFE